MKTRGNKSGRGSSKQVLVLIIIGMLGFAIIAVNGGMILFQRQVAQNAADAASLSGALALTQGYSLGQIENVVFERAREQGFDAEDPNTSVELSWMSEIVGAGASFSNYLRVAITTDYGSIFSAIFNSDENYITVDAVAHARMHEDLAPGYAVVSLNEQGCQGLGAGKNSEAESSEDDCWQEIGLSSSSNIVPVTGGTEVSLSEISLPDCSGLHDYGDVVVKDSSTLQPGKYRSITVGADALVNMNPGLYCIYGAELDGNSFLMNDDAWVAGESVMLYLMEEAGSFRTSSTSVAYLYAADYLVDQSGQQWGGMLVYAHPDNDSEFIFTGTSKTTYRGTIYAPGGSCEARGTSGFVNLKSQLVCNTVRFSDLNGLYVSYDMSTNYHLPEVVEIME